MKRKYISLINDGPKNVVLSQVVEYFQLLKNDSMLFDLLFFMNGNDYLNKYKNLPRLGDEIASVTGGKVSFFPVPRKGTPVGDSIAMAMLRYITSKYKKDNKLIIHARGGAAYYASLLKNRNDNLSYVFDCRGVNNYEFEAQKAGVPVDVIKKNVQKIYDKEKLMATGADHIICVSSVLKNIVIDKYNIPDEKISVIPCTADKSKFYYDKEKRRKKRADLNIDDKFVFVYPGGIGKWHNTENIFKLINSITTKWENCFFIILTPDEKPAHELAAEYLTAGRYLIKNAKREEVPEFLMAGDMGILLRERHPVNEVAAPTKFAEYMMTGLPAMISEHVGDYSSFVSSNECGMVVGNADNTEEIINKFGEYMNRVTKTRREENAGIGMENFSKSAYIDTLRDIYQNV